MAKWDMPAPKPWWKSKTVWFNVATALVAISTELAPLANLPYGNTEVIQSIIILCSVLGNTMLRFVTNSPVRR